MNYVLADAAALGFAITPDEARDLSEVGEQIKAAAAEQVPVSHPDNPEIHTINQTLFAGPLGTVDGVKRARNGVIVSPGRLDRSPCGTGTSARLAVMHARGQIAEGEEFVHESIIGTVFRGRITGTTQIGGRPAILPAITGRAWITGFHQHVLDPSDPFPTGYTLSDTWPREAQRAGGRRRVRRPSLREWLPFMTSGRSPATRTICMTMPAERIETDFLGPIAVPSDTLFGSQTARALTNFRISGIPLSDFPSLIRRLAVIKRAAAHANVALGDLEASAGEAIQKACDEIIDGRHHEHFGIDVFQGGAGTSTNMNVNEGVANRANQILGHAAGRYDVVHPNDHVDRSQSTNDVYPTALRMAVRADAGALKAASLDLAASFDAKGVEFAHVAKLGRTQLQDAVPMTLGQEFGAFATTIREDLLRLDESARLLAEVNLGGTAVGTGIAADSQFRSVILRELADRQEELVPAENLIEASWDGGPS